MKLVLRFMKLIFQNFIALTTKKTRNNKIFGITSQSNFFKSVAKFIFWNFSQLSQRIVQFTKYNFLCGNFSSILKKFVLCIMLLNCYVNADSKNLYKLSSSCVHVKVKKRAYPSESGIAKEPFHTTGTGVVVSENGYILVSNSLIGEETSAIICFEDLKPIDATVVGRDLITDLALLKINIKKLQPIEWETEVVPGQDIFVIGGPYNLYFSVLKSSVAAQLRKCSTFEKTKVYSGSAWEYFNSDLLQYESHFNVLLSHSVLFSSNGKCIGIRTSAFDKIGILGFDFAVPAVVAKKVANDLVVHGKVIRKRIGVSMQMIDKTLFNANMMHTIPLKNYEPEFGVIITVEKGSRAQKAGLRDGDIVVYIDNVLITDIERMQEIIVNAGEKLSIQVWRKKSGDQIAKQSKENSHNVLDKKGNISEKELLAEESKNENNYSLIKIEVNPEQMKYNLSKKNYVNESQFFHLQMLQYTKDEKLLRTYANASELIQHGLFVTRINDSNLAKVLSVNDIILEIQGQKIETIQDFDKILGSSLKKNEKYIILLIVRNGKTYSKAIELREVSIKE